MKMIRKLNVYFALLTGIFVCFIVSYQSASAQSVTGTCGSHASFTYDSKTKILEIFGKGSVDKKISVKKARKKKTEAFVVKKLMIHEGITQIKDSTVLQYADSPMVGGTEVLLPDSFQKISYRVFGSLEVKELYIPQNVSKIEVSFGFAEERITVSPKNQFYASENGILFNKNFAKLLFYPPQKQGRYYSVPKTVTKIAPLAFSDNKYLKEVRLPSGLKKLGGGAFFNCSHLEKINISELSRLKRIKDYNGKKKKLFYGNTSNSYYDAYLSEDEHSVIPKSHPRQYYGTFEGTALRTFTMPSGLKYIASETFRDCGNLSEMVIGKSFTGEINTGKADSQTSVLLFLTPLKSIKVSAGNKKYLIYNNALYTKDKKILCQVFADNREDYDKALLTKPYVIGKETSQIANGAFFRTHYTKVIAKGRLDRIGAFAFADSRIKKFTAYRSIQKICYRAFTSSRIKTIVFDENLQYIGKFAFDGCNKLTEIVIPATAVLDDHAFYGAENLEHIIRIPSKQVQNFLKILCALLIL